jgi:hypothetical protein
VAASKREAVEKAKNFIGDVVSNFVRLLSKHAGIKPPSRDFGRIPLARAPANATGISTIPTIRPGRFRPRPVSPRCLRHCRPSPVPLKPTHADADI